MKKDAAAARTRTERHAVAAGAEGEGRRRPAASDAAADALVRFCIDQRSAFEPAAWLAKFEEYGEPVALAAKYLSMTSWYGHEAELERVSAAMPVFADNSNGLHVETRAMEFNLHAFSLRVRLGLAHARRVPRDPARHAPFSGES